MKKIILFSLLLCTLVTSAQNQINNSPEYTVNGYFDTLYDHLGNKYATKSLRINPDGPDQTTASSVSCTAGYFRLFFDIGSAFDGSAATAVNRRAVMCQLYTDLSCLLISPLSSPCNSTPNNTTFVNVRISDGGNFGSAVPIFAAPGNATVGATVVDCMAFKTIITGTDPYTTIAGPVLTSGANNYFHILMRFNPSVNWHTVLTSTIGSSATQPDLYTVALHEALHGLGFASLIGPNGQSLYAPLQNIYNKYDLRLRAGTGYTPVISSTNIPCAYANLTLNVLPNQINPGTCTTSANTNITNSVTMCHYVSSSTSMTVPIYTPNCFELGSSFSHFEDQWYPIGGPYYGNDQYFVMTNQFGGPNFGMKRYPREEEKIALCDLGYSVAASYVSPVAGAPYTYTTGGCQGPGVWGINDGIVNSVYTYTNVGLSINIPTLAIKANDSPNTTQIDCVSLCYNYPNIGISVSNGSVIISRLGGPILYCGVVLAQYIPKDINGVPGNVTYIYSYFDCGTCSPPNLCDLVQNGGFENIPNSSTCIRNWGVPNTPFCWGNYVAGGSPDLFNMTPACASATPATFLGAPSVTSFYGGITSTYNGVPNNKVAGVIGSWTTSSSYVEVIKNDLSAPLIPTQTYVLSFWAFNSQAFYNAAGLPNVITFATRLNSAAVGGPTYPWLLDNVIASFTLQPSDLNTWKHYTTTVVFNNTVTPGQNDKCLIVGPNPAAAKLLSSNPANDFYTFIDDVSLQTIQNALIFSPPTTICNNTCLQKISQYCNQPTAVFSGPFVTLNSGDYDFCPTSPGNYTIVASYTNNVGCSYTTQAVIIVPGVSITPSSTLFCNYLNYTLSATPIPTNINVAIPFWQPQNIFSTSVVVPGNNNTIYSLNSTYNGCPLFAFFTPTIVPNTIITATPDIWCATPNAAYSMSVSAPNFTLAPLTLTWSPPINSNSNPVSVSYSNVINPTYSVITSVAGCTNLASYTATWIAPPTIAIIGGTNCIPANQSATLQAVSSTTLPVTYTWQPGNFNTAQIIVSPTVPTTYTLSQSYSNCALSNTITMYPAPQFTNLPASICSGQTFSYLQNLLAPGTPLTGTFTGVGVFGPQLLTSFSVSTSSAPGPYSVTYSYLTPAGCFATNTVVLNVSQGVSLTVPNPTVTYCSNIAVGASVVAVATPTTGVTFLWNPGSITTSSFIATPLVSTDYTLIASIGSCSAVARVYVAVNNSCCASTNYINTSAISNVTLSGLYAINQNLTINGAVAFGGEFLVAPNVSITVVPGATLTSTQFTPGAVSNGLHMRSCYDMWSGIGAQNGAKVIFKGGDFIEDAKSAVTSDGCTTTGAIDIDMSNVVFNRNDISIAIKNYNQATTVTPFSITNCVFTCRDYGIPIYSLSWPTALAAPLLAISGPTNVLTTPYLVGSTPTINLKAPLATRASSAGVYVENSGITLNPTSNTPIYYSINVNDDNTSNYNIFDNLLSGISALNSNVVSYNNVFQNTRRFNFTPLFLAGGYGIYSVFNNSGSVNNGRLNIVSAVSPTVFLNKFYDCHFAIYAYNLFDLNVQYHDFRSMQNSSVPFTNGLRGQYAIYAQGNRYKAYTIKNNNFQNIRTPIRIGSVSGALNLPSIPNFGMYLGKIIISDNLFSPTIGTVAPVGNGFINLGIYADAVLGPSTNTANTFYEPGATLRIVTNNFSRVYRASQVSGFSNSTFNAVNANNRVTMIPDIIAPLSSQFGIAHYVTINDIVNTNTITGNATTLNQTRVSGIYKSMDRISSTQCNSVVSVYAGFEFEGNNTGAFWRSNTMNSNRRGLQLKSNYLLSQQGSANAPSDNIWQGSWAGNNGTWVDGSATTSLSPLAVRTITPYFALNPGGFASQRYQFSNFGTLIAANNSAPISPCYPTTPPCPNCNPSLVSSLNSIVLNAITYSLNPIETEEINKDLTYNDINIEPTLLDTSLVLTSFNSVNNNGTRGAFKNIRANIQQGNFVLVNALLNAINPNSNIENNTKTFFTIYSNFISNGSISPNERLALFILAHQCPFTDGPVVYEARGLLNTITEEVELYTDTYCAELGFSYRGSSDSSNSELLATDNLLLEQLKVNEKVSSKKFKTFTRYELYPNPAVNSINISSSKASEKLEVKILDVNGRLIIGKPVLISGYNTELNFNLLNGIYFVHLINEQGEKTIKKLVIAKD